MLPIGFAGRSGLAFVPLDRGIERYAQFANDLIGEECPQVGLRSAPVVPSGEDAHVSHGAHGLGIRPTREDRTEPAHRP